MTAQIRVNLFGNSDLDRLKDEINDWLEAENLGPDDIPKSNMSEEGTGWTVMVWYIPRPVERERKSDIPTFEEVMNQCPHCGARITQPAEEETLPRTWQDNCPQWKQGGTFCGYHRDWHGPNGECPTSEDEAKKFRKWQYLQDQPPF